MPNCDPQESKDEVLDELMEHLYRGTPQLLRGWRSRKLLSPAIQHGAGRGSAVSLPAGTARQSIAVFQELHKSRSVGYVRFRLWFWHHYQTDENWLRGYFAERVHKITALRDQLENTGLPEAGRDILDKISAKLRSRVENKVISRLRRAVGSKDRFGEIAHVLILVMLDLFPKPSGPEDGSPFNKAYIDVAADLADLGRALDHEISPQELNGLWGSFYPERIGEAFDSMSLQVLERRRNRLNSWIEYWRFWLTEERRWNVERTHGKRFAEILALTFNDPDFDVEIALFLLLVDLPDVPPYAPCFLN